MNNVLNKDGTDNTLAYKGLRDIAILRLFIFPTIILLVVINIFPLFWSLYLSFTKYSVYTKQSPVWIGAQNYANILTNPDFWQQFSTTAYFVLIVVTAELILGFGMAYLLHQKFKARAFYITMLAVPMMMSPALVGISWKYIYNPSWGVINWLFRLGPVDWISNPNINLYSVAIVDIWMWTPFIMLLSIAGLSAIPDYLYEAAEIDRASGWFKFWNITIPISLPLLLIALIFRTMEAFKTFDIPMSITGVGAISPKLLALRLYDLAFYRWDTGVSCAMAYILLFIVIAITNIYVRFLNKMRQ